MCGLKTSHEGNGATKSSSQWYQPWQVKSIGPGDRLREIIGPDGQRRSNNAKFVVSLLDRAGP